MTAPAPPVFALLDDQAAPSTDARSRLYTGFVRTHRCDDPATLEAVCAAVQADLGAGLHAVLLADYEWGVRLQGVALSAAQAAAPGALQVLCFTHCERLDAASVEAWLQQHDGALAEPTPAGVLGLRTEPAEGFEGWFDAAIARIHEAIRAGETYQVNFTHALTGQAFGSPVALYRRLRQRQPAAHGALIALADGSWVLSCSPEGFVRRQGDAVTAEPMKGTAARGEHAAVDAAQAAWLQGDVKNRAENLMIVDLLRNDLGRIAQVGSVQVPRLFHVAAHGPVWQMTSTVEARLRPGTGLAELLRATFPCGSITGAPKRRTMEWIGQLEAAPRGLYTGAIGWLQAPAQPGQAGPDLCLSVAIRTLLLGPMQADGLRPTRLGVGAGIVQDSVAAAERDECRLKASFLTGLDPGFELFETLWATRETGARHIDAHLARLSRSAAALGFALGCDCAAQLLRHTTDRLPPGQPHRLRLSLRAGGKLACTAAPLAELSQNGSLAHPVSLRLAEAPIDPAGVPLALRLHKTSLRRAYDAGVREAEAVGCFDTLFFTADGWLTEGGRSNVFVKLDGRWCTPPVSEGVLPGVARAQVLADAAWAATERRIHRDELHRAEGWMVCNALRGALFARVG